VVDGGVEGLLRDRRFDRFLAARTLSMLGSAFAPVALAFGVLGLPGATAGTLAAVLAGEAIPVVAFLLFGGVIADRFRRNRVMVAGELLNALGYAAIAGMLLSGSETHAPSIALLVAAAAVCGIGTAVLWPALTAIVVEIVEPGRRQTANALVGLVQNIARVVGLVSGGAVVIWVGAGWSLAGSALLFVGAALLIFGLRLPRRDAGHSAASPTGTSVFRELREGWDEFRSRQWLWVVVVQFSVLVMALQAAHGVLGPVVAKTELGGAGAWTAVLAGEAVGTIAGVLLALRIRPRRPILVATCLSAVPGVLYVFLGIGAPVWLTVLAAVGMGISFDLFGVLWQTTMQREVPEEALSRVSSYDAFGSMAFGPIGLLLAGPAAALFGAHAALIGCGVIIALTAAAALCAPGVRNLTAPRGPDGHPAVLEPDPAVVAPTAAAAVSFSEPPG